MAGYDDKRLDNLISRTFKKIKRESEPLSVGEAWSRLEGRLPQKTQKRGNWQFVLPRVAALVLSFVLLTGAYIYTHPQVNFLAKGEQAEQSDGQQALLGSAAPRVGALDTVVKDGIAHDDLAPDDIATDMGAFSAAAPEEEGGAEISLFKNRTNTASVESETVGISVSRVLGHVERLAAFGERSAGSPAENEAASYIYNTLVEYGVDTSMQEFRAEMDGKPIISRNIIGVRRNNSPGTVYLTAHYDSIGGPGAIDNASGVGVLLELARVSGNMGSEASLIFVAFGAEEPGLLGSRAFVSNLEKDEIDDILAVVNIDTVGYGERFEPGYVAEGGKLKLTPFWLLQRTYDISREMGLEIEMYSWAVNGHHLGRKIYGYENGQHKSDHISFLEKGIPAVGITFGPALYFDRGGPLHSPGDTFDMVSGENLKNAGKMVIALVEDITDTPGLSDRERDLGDRYFVVEFKDELYGLNYAAGIILIALTVFVILAAAFLLVRMLKRAA